MMTSEEFFGYFENGFRCLCKTPEECMDVLVFLEDNGYVVSDCSQYHMDPGHPEYHKTNCICPGIDERYTDGKHVVCYTNHSTERLLRKIFFEQVPIEEQSERWWLNTNVDGFMDLIFN